jgi:UDP-2,3-diacylglucosamine pyrophosphatase LpxH
LDGLAGKFDFMGEGVGGRLSGEPLAFEHGDLINTRDRLYRFWNLVSRSGPLWLCGMMMPAFMGKKIASALEKRLRTTNLENKAVFPKREFQRAASECGSDVFITGHFHRLERVGNGTSIPWAHSGDFWLWQNGELTALDLGSESHDS